MATKPEIAQLVAVLRAAYPRQVISQTQYNQLVTVWADLLSDLPFQQLQLAAKQHSTTSPWFPSVAEIRQASLDLIAPPEDRLTAMEAWQEVKHSFGTAPTFWSWSSAVVKQAYEALGGDGWRCEALVENEPADRARFCQVFEALQKRRVSYRRALPEVRAVLDAPRDPELALIPDDQQLEARRQFTALVRGMVRDD